MAGAIFGIPLSQRVDANGKPAVGWLCYHFVQNTSTPVDTYLDTALSVKNSWPVVADAFGMIGPMWLPDGAYRIRATSSDGSVVFFDLTSVTALGPSSGAVISGGVDPNAIFQTGDTIWAAVNTTRPGWVRDNGRTMGNATSGGQERQNADTQALFIYLYTNFTDAQCPVSGGRTGNALNDFNASKTITLPDMRGRIPGGLDDMGNSPASRWGSVPIVSGTPTTAGAILGEATHVLSSGEMPSHNHSASQGTHSHGLTQFNYLAPVSAGTPGGGNVMGTTATSPASTAAASAGSISIGSTGGGALHNNVQQTVLGTFFRKL